MKCRHTLFLLLLTLLTFTVQSKAQTPTDTIRFSVKPNTEAEATNTLVYNSYPSMENVRMEWVSGGNRTELSPTGNGISQELS
ncbi:MAG: hypothetical protein K2I83_02690, partial [Bacteroidales bacterium]|nr:hypothetical protein [Bacteroidales bacterium]